MFWNFLSVLQKRNRVWVLFVLFLAFFFSRAIFVMNYLHLCVGSHLHLADSLCWVCMQKIFATIMYFPTWSLLVPIWQCSGSSNLLIDSHLSFSSRQSDAQVGSSRCTGQLNKQQENFFSHVFVNTAINQCKCCEVLFNYY